jgi:hypothetical protein
MGLNRAIKPKRELIECVAKEFRKVNEDVA